MCRQNTTKFIEINGKNIEVDACLVKTIVALNQAGVETTSCCCGHGIRPGKIVLADGKEMMIVQDFETARKIELMFGGMYGRVKKGHRKKLG